MAWFHAQKLWNEILLKEKQSILTTFQLLSYWSPIVTSTTAWSNAYNLKCKRKHLINIFYSYWRYCNQICILNNLESISWRNQDICWYILFLLLLLLSKERHGFNAQMRTQNKKFVRLCVWTGISYSWWGIWWNIPTGEGCYWIHKKRLILKSSDCHVNDHWSQYFYTAKA